MLKETSVKDEVKKAVDAALKKSEREIKLAKEETANFKTKAEDMEQKFTRVIYIATIYSTHYSIIMIRNLPLYI